MHDPVSAENTWVREITGISQDAELIEKMLEANPPKCGEYWISHINFVTQHSSQIPPSNLVAHIRHHFLEEISSGMISERQIRVIQTAPGPWDTKMLPIQFLHFHSVVLILQVYNKLGSLKGQNTKAKFMAGGGMFSLLLSRDFYLINNDCFSHVEMRFKSEDDKRACNLKDPKQDFLNVFWESC